MHTAGNLIINGAAAVSLSSTASLTDKLFAEDIEFAYMMQSEVGTDGHMGSDPNWVGFGSDMEEDSTSQTSVSDSFRFDYELGYNVYALAFSIPANPALGYQYAYTTIRYRDK